MKTLRVLAMVAMVALVATALSYAQPPAGAKRSGGAAKAGPRGGGQPMTAATALDAMTKHLALSKVQKAKIKPILDAQFKQVAALMASKSLTQQQRWDKMRKLGTDAEAKIRAILTTQQRAKYDAQRRDMFRRGQQAMDRGAMDMWTRSLGLTKAQQVKVKPILAQQRKSLEALGTQKLTAQQRQAKMRAIMDASMAKVRALLSAAQKKKLDQLGKQFAAGGRGGGPRGGGGPGAGAGRGPR